MVYIEKGTSHKIFVKQKVLNKETKKFTRIFMTFKCDTLDIVSY